MTLEEWFDENLPGLKDSLAVHADAFCGLEGPDLLRVMMISIRQHLENSDRFKEAGLEDLAYQAAKRTGWR